MKAIVLDGFGGPEVLRLSEVPTPEPRSQEILVRVVASAVNRADTSQRRGTYPPPAGAPPYPGLECSGVIVAVGDEVVQWAVGDEVCALLGGGGYAEYVSVHWSHVLPKPSAVSLEDSAALTEAACTVIANLASPHGLNPAERVLVHGGGSGIGTTAIQWAKTLGCTVLTTVGSDANAQACRDLGADLVINYKNQDFVSACIDKTDGHGVDVVLDIVGADYLQRNLATLAVGGRLHSIGVQSGSVSRIDLKAIMTKRLILTGSTLRSRSTLEKADVVAKVRDSLWPHYDSGAMRPVIDRRFPLEQAADAHRHLESSTHFGKVVLTVKQH